MKVYWTPEAQQDRVEIWDYIAADKPLAAARMDKLFSDAAVGLATHAGMIFTTVNGRIADDQDFNECYIGVLAVPASATKGKVGALKARLVQV